MRTDMPAEIWLDPYRWEALQEILEQDGTDIEEVLQNYLIEVYSDRVPIERQKVNDFLAACKERSVVASLLNLCKSGFW